MARYCIERGANEFPDKVALKVIAGLDDDAGLRSWTYRDLDQQVRRIGGALRDNGLNVGDRILIRMDNCPEYALLFFGAIAGGIIPIPASSQLSAHEVDFIAQDSGARAIVLSDNLDTSDHGKDTLYFTEQQIANFAAHGRLIDWQDSLADDPAYLVYTSGTTSHPKGVLHAHRAAWGRRPMYQGWYGLSSDDTMLHAGAFNWTYTLGVGLTDPWANCATAIVYTGARDATIWPTIIERSGATVFAAVPTVYRQILKYCDLKTGQLGLLRHGLTAGEPLPEDVATSWFEKTGMVLYEAFGMSEISTFISSSPGMTPPRSGSPGKPQDGRNVAILDADDGETPLPANEIGIIAIHRSDPGLMLGYWDRPEEEAAVMRGDWFLSGDRAAMDEDGYIWLDGRSDDMMNAFGYRVSPFEVESVLSALPGIGEVAVAEREVRKNVRLIVAFIVPAPALSGDQSEQELRRKIIDFAGEELAEYKRPHEIVFVSSLPRTANGKLKRGDLVLPDTNQA
ncbi:MAG: acyl--CoA ligase [Rhizobiales bacterium]|nr:acyl--CoA ligase [Hyphomicrobiales bacterium]